MTQHRKIYFPRIEYADEFNVCRDLGVISNSRMLTWMIRPNMWMRPKLAFYCFENDLLKGTYTIHLN